jgi:hypothetical protein
MKTDLDTMQIPMQVGSEIRINNFGEVAIGNPELVLANEPHAVGAVLSYRFDAKTGEHILRLLHPEAHLKRARAQRDGGS